MITPGRYVNASKTIIIHLNADGSFWLKGIVGLETPDGRYKIGRSPFHNDALGLSLSGAPGLPNSNASYVMPVKNITDTGFTAKDGFICKRDNDGNLIEEVFKKEFLN